MRFEDAMPTNTIPIQREGKPSETNDEPCYPHRNLAIVSGRTDRTVNLPNSPAFLCSITSHESHPNSRQPRVCDLRHQQDRPRWSVGQESQGLGAVPNVDCNLMRTPAKPPLFKTGPDPFAWPDHRSALTCTLFPARWSVTCQPLISPPSVPKRRGRLGHPVTYQSAAVADFLSESIGTQAREASDSECRVPAERTVARARRSESVSRSPLESESVPDGFGCVQANRGPGRRPGLPSPSRGISG